MNHASRGNLSKEVHELSSTSVVLLGSTIFSSNHIDQVIFFSSADSGPQCPRHGTSEGKSRSFHEQFDAKEVAVERYEDRSLPRQSLNFSSRLSTFHSILAMGTFFRCTTSAIP